MAQEGAGQAQAGPRLSTFFDSLSPELREVLDAFHDGEGGHVTLEEMKVAAEKWKESKGDRKSYSLKAFPEGLAKELAAFDLNGDGTVDKHELGAAAKLYAHSRREASMLRRMVVFLALLCVILIAAMFGVSYGAAELAKDMHSQDSGVMRVAPGVVAGTAAAVEPVDLQDLPDLDLQTLSMISMVSFSGDGFDNTIRVGSISKARPEGSGSFADDYSGDVHITAASGQVLTIWTNGTMEYEGSLLDPTASGRRLAETSGSGNLQLSTGDSNKGCKTYCLRNKKWSWPEMCGDGKNWVVNKCQGCQQCSDDADYSGSCATDCGSLNMASKKKCKLNSCSGCAECGSVETTAAPTTTPAPPPAPQIGAFTATAGAAFTATVPELALPSPVRVDLESPPAGLSINERSRVLTWQPDASQVGEHTVFVLFFGSDGAQERRSVAMTVLAGADNPQGIYVWPAGGADDAAGSAAAPLASLELAARQAQPGDTIFVRGGRYPAKFDIEVQATAEKPVVITRLPGERVLFLPPTGKNAFTVPEDSIGVVFRGFEIYGGAEKDDHWEILRSSWWQLQDTRTGGDMGFNIHGQHITVEECVIHDLSQKGVNVKDGRYVTVKHNVIYNIGQTSISGGHGIMRQWPKSFNNADDPNFYRWDFYGNLLFGVEQRIYSFIPWKAYCHMTIDEGKTILIDETRDEEMKARIAHNVLLYGGINHITLKKNPNMEVLNNVILAEEGRTSPAPSGITAVKRPLIPNLTVKNNLVESYNGSWGFDILEHFPDEAALGRLSNNFYGGGGRVRRPLPGITDLGLVKMYRDPAAFDFSPNVDVPEGVGVSDEVVEKLHALVEDYAVEVRASGWRHDHVRMVETILESAPREHLEFRGEGDSKKESDKRALWFDVVSDTYRDLCKCKDLELIPPKEYWEAYQ